VIDSMATVVTWCSRRVAPAGGFLATISAQQQAVPVLGVTPGGLHPLEAVAPGQLSINVSTGEHERAIESLGKGWGQADAQIELGERQ
jgi:hypothetical protein